MSGKVAGLVVGFWMALVGSALAQRVQMTLSGTLESMDTSTGVLVMRFDSGSRKKAQLVPGCKFKNGDRAVTASAFMPGRKIMIRLCGPMNENPVKVDLVSDWFSSGQYVATHAPAPYNTKMGDFATTGGAGGSPQGLPGIQRPETTIGILGNGGKLNLNPPGANDNPINQGQKMAAAQMMLNNMDTGMPGATAAMMGLDSDGNGGGGQGGPPGAGGMGIPVNMQARVLRADPGSRVLQVQAINNNVPQNVIIPANVNLPMLSAGSFVTIVGQTNPSAGCIEATQIIPMNQGAPMAPTP